MLAKYWKKIGLIIVIIACVLNVMIKLINKLSFDTEMLSSAKYIYEQNQEEDKKEKQEKNQKKLEENSINQKKEK